MKTFIAGLLAVTAFAAIVPAASAMPHHKMKVCHIMHHHKVCHWK